MNTIHDEMNKRFDERFGRIVMAQETDFFGKEPYGTNDIKAFIQSEIDIAVKNEREKTIDECIAIVNSNQKGAFTDDGGNNCWYIDELITNLTNLKNNG